MRVSILGPSCAAAAVLAVLISGFAWSAAEAGREVSREDVLNAPVLTEERIEVPARAGTGQGPGWVLRPAKDGYILLFLFFDYGILFDDSEAVAVDTVTGEATRFTIPRGLNISMALERGVLDDEGRFYCFFPCEGVGELWRYDPHRNALESLGSPPFDRGRGYNRITVSEGRIVGTVNSLGEVGVYEYDPKAGRFHSYGFVSPKQTQGGETHGYSVTVAGGHVYVAVGKVPWRLVALDRATGKAEVILEAPAGNSQIWVTDDYAIRRPDPNNDQKMEQYALRDGKAVLVDREWTFGKRPPGPKPAVARPQVRTDELAPTPEGVSVVQYKLPGDAEWKRVELKVKTYAQSIRRLVALPDGRLLGSVGSYQGCFICDPKTGVCEQIAPFKLSQYATLVHDGKVYMSGYPSSPVYVYDPARPAAAAGPDGKRIDEKDARSNPRLLACLTESWSHKMWGGAAGADGCLFFCGEVARKGDGGALGWWDTKAEKAGAVAWETFAGYKTLYAASAMRGEKIVLNSHVTIDNITGKTPDTARMFLFDVNEKKIVAQVEPIEDAKMLGPLVETEPGRILSAACLGGYREDEAECVLFAFDVEKRSVLFRKKLPVPLAAWNGGMRGGQEFELGPDGFVWTYLGEVRSPETPTLVRIDPRDGAIYVVGRVQRRGPIAFVGKDLYRGCEHKAGELGLRRLAKVVP